MLKRRLADGRIYHLPHVNLEILRIRSALRRAEELARTSPRRSRASSAA
jgi:hypothetical protein